MAVNSSRPTGPVEGPPGRRVTSIARWLARRQQTAQVTPRLSIVMPVYNAESTLAECLTRVFQSTLDGFEVVLVDDGSTDNTRAIAEEFPVRVVPSGGRVGPAAARNVGAREALGDFIFFIDSDVMVRPDTLSRLMARFDQGDVDGLVGVQALELRYRNLPSRYKNLWMRWTYLRKQSAAEDVPCFYTTAAAIRRDVFLRVGGFDQGYGGPSVEDQAFAQKLMRLGVRIRVQPELEVEHVKRYSLRTMLKTDYHRAVSLTRLQLRHREDLSQNNTPVPTPYIVSVLMTGIGLAGFVLGGILGSLAVFAVGGVASVTALALNYEFLDVIRRSEGVGRTLTSLPLMWLELLTVGVGTAVGLISYPFGKRY